VVAGGLRARLRAVGALRAAAGVPDASISATRVSPRSTLTRTCFFTFLEFL
jgi:hypothetical protein